MVVPSLTLMPFNFFFLIYRSVPHKTPDDMGLTIDASMISGGDMIFLLHGLGVGQGMVDLCH